MPDWSGASWAHELGTLVVRSRPEHPHFDGPGWQEAVRAADGWDRPREIRVTAYQRTDPERIVAHLSTISWIAGMPESERSEAVEQIRRVVMGGEMPDELPTHFVIGLAALSA